ncbi:DNA- and iron-binding antioxidant protein/ferroxidase Dps [Psychroflexus torquis ATCC 700755]|uniref:DNA-and iron-binding antioxidant protein/ferroxidase Dps n=1 Tax=Psychroflexus torquis (strain ATCC 700755 / CIP 106069 / ACAM 623) TaxID=313595 RepID=K4IXN5_PSYTT|nr:DNA starvation/stationary phase protection protein [Psychroflexus torquis]AFU70240.1 DNA- and iron-binding antioxidant protein/ferroxidase Dps [Psychroflexus torquis ATCC 700755]
MSYLVLDESKTKDTIKELNIVLADYHMYYQKLRNFHWNVIGQNFFDLHVQFEDMYNGAKVKIDEIAERILTLRFKPKSNFTDYLNLSNLKETSSNIQDHEMVSVLLEDHSTIINQMRNVVDSATKNDDEGTIDLIGAYIRQLEKTSWMLDAWIMKIEEKQHA